jgi:hypothetical protein
MSNEIPRTAQPISRERHESLAAEVAEAEAKLAAMRITLDDALAQAERLNASLDATLSHIDNEGNEK